MFPQAVLARFCIGHARLLPIRLFAWVYFYWDGPKFWLNLRMKYDLRVAKRTLQKEMEPRIHVF
jgi:hypothetical protein